MQANTVAAVELRADAAMLNMRQADTTKTAIAFSWNAFAGGSETPAGYTLEAAIAGSQFNNPVELVTTLQPSVSFNVRAFNEQLRKMIMADTRELVEFRIRINVAEEPPRYSNVVAVDVRAYQPYSLYDESQVLRLPGNYQNWTIATAPRVVSANRNGVYEGFALFTNANSQFYLVKGTEWNNVTTYNQTGPNSFGFNGTYFLVPGGAGVNRISVNMNTNTWSSTKINSFGLYGTTTGNTDATMVFDAPTLSWNLTRDLAKGEFVFRADRSNTVVFGHNGNSSTGIADADGEKICIPKAGNYTVALFLGSAGNYAFGIRRNK